MVELAYFYGRNTRWLRILANSELLPTSSHTAALRFDGVWPQIWHLYTNTYTEIWHFSIFTGHLKTLWIQWANLYLNLSTVHFRSSDVWVLHIVELQCNIANSWSHEKCNIMPQNNAYFLCAFLSWLIHVGQRLPCRQLSDIKTLVKLWTGLLHKIYGY